MTDPKIPKRPTWLYIVIGLLGFLVVALAVAALFVHLRQDGSGATGASNESGGGAALASGSGTAVEGVPEPSGPVAMEVPDLPPRAAVIVDIYDAVGLKALFSQNAWLKEVLTKPLGQGFVGSWAGFLGTKGEDLRASFTGTVIDLLLDRVFTQPFSVVWFDAARQAGVPAVILDEPNSAAKAAFEALDTVASRGTFTALRCLADKPENTEAQKQVRDLKEITIKRWLLADHALYAGLAGDRLVLARKASTVQNGLCVQLAKLQPTPGVAIAARLEPQAFSRDAQVFASALGLNQGPNFAFGIENNTLVPRGISGALANADRLVSGKLSGENLKAIPEDAPVVLALQLALPKQLDQDNLGSYFKGEKLPLAPRQVVFVWYPHGAMQTPDLAILWSEKADKAALESLFTNNLSVENSPICGQLALTSNPTMTSRLQKSCSGKSPAITHLEGPVVSGLQENASVLLAVNVGALLTRLTTESFASENPKATLPPEMLEAEKQLKALPFIGLRGLVQGQALVQGGFRS